ncbi:hypothetical protein GOV11_05070 [Candidatus Woesearchaeota archaeon]|nr:hypothetical protein [Candidatus Woesearchaeota archaeon]
MKWVWVVVLVLLFSQLASARIMPEDFTYVGGFRVECSGTECTYNLDAMAIAPNGGLWVSDHVYNCNARRISTPEPLDSSTYSDLPAASTLEGPYGIGACGSTSYLDGLEVIGDEISATHSDYYNVAPEYIPVFYRRPGAPGQEVGPQEFPFHPNKMGGYEFMLPSDWVQANNLGTKNMVTGYVREAAAHGGSKGPALIAFDPENPIDAMDLLWYREYGACDYPDYENPCDFPDYENSDDWYGADWVRTDSGDAILFVGNKANSNCYGTGGTDGDCFDPCNSYKGYHGYPYHAKILFYDPADLSARLRGEVEPWEILPYAEWLPDAIWSSPDCGAAMISIAFDEESGRLYIAQGHTGEWGAGMIHVFETTGGSSCHWADSDCDSTIGISELVLVIQNWMSGSRSISELVEVIQLWQNG